jgi:transcription initiation factor IIE alpha subunit
MGDGIIVQCSNCSMKRDFYLGLGWAYSSLETVIDAIHPSKREEVRRIFKDHKVLQRETGWRLYLCGKCKRLYDRFWVKIKYDDDQVYKTEFTCPKCGGKLSHLRDTARISDLPCIYCGERTLAVEGEFLWD